VHHFADQIVDYLKSKNQFGIRIVISREDDELLDTGGGLKKAADFFLEDPRRLDEPFILHNVDVISTIDLQRMVRFHTEHQALATLAVKDRPTSRYLLFDDQLQLCGRRSTREQKNELVRPCPDADALAFSGIHVISPRIFGLIRESGVFSIITSYLSLAARGEAILAFRADDSDWRDLGKLEDVKQASSDPALVFNREPEYRSPKHP